MLAYIPAPGIRHGYGSHSDLTIPMKRDEEHHESLQSQWAGDPNGSSQVCQRACSRFQFGTICIKGFRISASSRSWT